MKKVVVVDSLVTGHRAAVHPDAIFYQGDLSDQDFMRKVFKEILMLMPLFTLRPIHWLVNQWKNHSNILITIQLEWLNCLKL